jgi:iron complex outermembrane recepter protein
MKYLLYSVSAWALATSAMAQDAPRAAPGGAGDSIGLSEVIVTAARRAEDVQRAALSIQALSSDALTKGNITNPEDLNSIAPGVSIAATGAVPQVYVRGVGNYSANSYAEAAVAFNLDGVYISRPWASRGMFYDLERVEVLKGPQGTLYGRNASGGAINIITVQPKLGETSGFAELQVGNYNLVQGTAAVNVPLGDTLALPPA